MALGFRPLIGARDIVYTLLDESSDVLSGTPTYGTIYSLPNAKKVSVNPNASGATGFYDDGPRVSAETMGDIDIELELGDLLLEDEARLLGHTYANGSIVRNISDQSPYIAMGFKLLRTGKDSGNLVYDYVWLYKGKLLKPSSEAMTKEDKINYQNVKLSGKFVGRQADSLWMLKIRTDDPSLPSGYATGFFSTVATQSADLTALTVTMAEGTVGDAGKILLTFAKGSGSSFSLKSSTISTSTIMVSKSSGTILPGTFSVGAPGTTVVVKFTPTTPFSSSDDVGIHVKGVQDTAGVENTIAGDVITIA